MELSAPQKQDAPLSRVDAPSLIFTLERGLQCIRQGQYVEGIELLELARKQLSADQVYLSAALDAFILGHTLYWQAQQALHQASQRFAEAVSAQQTRLAVLHNLLAALVEDQERASQSLKAVATHPVEDPRQYQVPEPTGDEQLLPSLYVTCFGILRSGAWVSRLRSAQIAVGRIFYVF